MTAVEWSAIVATATLAVVLGTIVWRLASRLAAHDVKAETTEKALQSTSQRCDALAKQLSEHKEQAAEKYVSYGHLDKLESRLVEAITSLGDRIDRLFSVRLSGAAP
jgi:uncharacterized membrane-anchored protein YhcB (DUF1043 family)